MDKHTLRKQLLNNRKNNLEKDNIIFEKIIKLPQFLKADIVLSYVSKRCEHSNDSEIDTVKLINYSLDNKRVFVPRTIGHEIEFYEISDLNDLELGAFGILEPKMYLKKIKNEILKKSVCITPALACNKENHRIGYGKGYYDRFLKSYNGISIAPCYKENIIDFNTDENDIRVNIVLTD